MLKEFTYNNDQNISFRETKKGRLESSDILISIFNASCRIVIDADEMEDSDSADINEAIDNLLKLDISNKAKIEPYIVEKYNEAKTTYYDEGDKAETQKDIWQKLVLRFIYVEKRRRNGGVYIKVQFDCEWDEEGGLQLVFNRSGKLVRVSSIDGWLTDADAYGKPDSADDQLNRFI